MQNDHLFRCEIGLQVDWNGSSACIMFAILNCTCNKFINVRSTFKWPRYEKTHHYVKAIRNKKVTPVWNSCRWKFSHVNSPLVCLTVHRLSNYPDSLVFSWFCLNILNPYQYATSTGKMLHTQEVGQSEYISGHKESLILELFQIIFFLHQ